MEYPEEIYSERGFGLLMNANQRKGLAGWGRRHAYLMGYEAGKAEQTDSLAGYSNLTAAIKAGDPIDWERLDGLKMQCVKPDVGTLKGKLERNESRPADNPAGWWHKGIDSLYRSAFIYGWTGYNNWILWIEGEVPLVRKTADQLEVGTYFLGNCKLVAEGVMYVGREEESVEKAIRFVPSMTVSQFGAEDWVVIEELGTFQGPEGK